VPQCRIFNQYTLPESLKFGGVLTKEQLGVSE